MPLSLLLLLKRARPTSMVTLPSCWLVTISTFSPCARSSGRAVISATVLGAMSIAVFYFHFDTRQAVTVSFCTLAFAQLWHVFNMRGPGSGLLFNEITRNLYVWAALLLCVGLILAAVYLPGLSTILGLSPMVAPFFFPEVFGAIEGRAAFWAPVGLVIMGGLTTSTFFTVMVIPTIYSLVDDLTVMVRRVVAAA